MKNIFKKFVIQKFSMIFLIASFFMSLCLGLIFLPTTFHMAADADVVLEQTNVIDLSSYRKTYWSEDKKGYNSTTIEVVMS